MALAVLVVAAALGAAPQTASTSTSNSSAQASSQSALADQSQAAPQQQQQQSQPQQPPQQPPQQEQQPSPPAVDLSRVPVSLDRIREGVQRQPRLHIDFLDPDTPIFRVKVEERALELVDRWKVRDTAVASYVGPSFGSTWHHEFLSMVTPKQQIAASPFGIFGNPIHPVGPPVLAISKAIKTAWQERQRNQIRQQIQAELKALDPNYQPPGEEKDASKTADTKQTPAGNNVKVTPP